MAASTITCPACGHEIEPLPAEVLEYGPVALRTDTRELFVKRRYRASLCPNPCSVLADLMRHSDRVCTSDHLLSVCDHWDVEPHILQVEVYQLRRVLRGTGVQIVGIWGRGYMLALGEWRRVPGRPSERDLDAQLEALGLA